MTTDDHDDTCRVTDCPKPGDGYYLCKDHALRIVVQIMENMPWVRSELETVATLQTKYTTNSDGRGGSTPVPMDFVAVDIRRELDSALIDAAARVATANAWTMPSTPEAAALFIVYRITGLRIHPDAGTLVDRILKANKSALYVIDRPVSRQYLGQCQAVQVGTSATCPGRVYGREWRTWATCDVCGTKWDAAQLRAYLIAELGDRLCTAAEIAHLSTYLDLSLTREQTRKRLNQWAKRGTLPTSGTRHGSPVFRFGTAELLLSRYAAQKSA